LYYPLSRSLSPKERGAIWLRGVKNVVYDLSDEADVSDEADPLRPETCPLTPDIGAKVIKNSLIS